MGKGQNEGAKGEGMKSLELGKQDWVGTAGGCCKALSGHLTPQLLLCMDFSHRPPQVKCWGAWLTDGKN